jgi:hypothetical protein
MREVSPMFLKATILAGLAAASPLAACRSGPADAPVGAPATLARADDETLAALRAALAQAVGRADAKLGPIAPDAPLAVLPPPLGPHETRSVAEPTLFDLELRDGACVAVRRDTGEAFTLKGVACIPR